MSSLFGIRQENVIPRVVTWSKLRVLQKTNCNQFLQIDNVWLLYYLNMYLFCNALFRIDS